MLKKLFTTFALTLFAAGMTHAETITDIDFDTNEPSSVFAFSGNGNTDVPTTTNLDDPNGVTGQGGSFIIDAGGPHTSGFAGGGFSSDMIDFALAGFTAGAITVADLDTVIISMDIATTGDGAGSFRLQPDGGGFNERIALDFNTSGNVDMGFLTYTNALADLDLAQKQLFVDTLNAGDDTAARLAFSFTNGADGYESGQSATFDNILVTTTAVPEPGSIALLGMIGMAGMIRRKRI